MSVENSPQVSQLVRLFDNDMQLMPGAKVNQSEPENTVINISQIIRQSEHNVKLRTPEKSGKSGNIWLFAYGSVFLDSEEGFKERHTGFIHGYKRR